MSAFGWQTFCCEILVLYFPEFFPAFCTGLACQNLIYTHPQTTLLRAAPPPTQGSPRVHKESLRECAQILKESENQKADFRSLFGLFWDSSLVRLRGALFRDSAGPGAGGPGRLFPGFSPSRDYPLKVVRFHAREHWPMSLDGIPNLGQLIEDLYTQESHHDHGRVFHYWSKHCQNSPESAFGWVLIGWALGACWILTGTRTLLFPQGWLCSPSPRELLAWGDYLLLSSFRSSVSGLAKMRNPQSFFCSFVLFSS